MVERGDQPDRFGQQHAVAEHVAAHVADARDGHRIGLHVHAYFEEMALNRNPRALGGDPHRLVVVAVAAAAGESVVEPEVGLFGDGVGDIGEGRGALVRRNHEVGILSIEHHDLRGMDDLAAHDVVGDRQQRADEHLIAGLALGQPAFSVLRRVGQALGIEPALGPGRHDHCVLDPLGLHQPEDFGAEIVAPVGPAQAAAGDRPGAQVDAFEAARVDEDLAPRQRFGQVRDERRVELEGERFVARGGERVGPQDRLDQRAVEPQQAVVVDRRHLAQRSAKRAVGGVDCARAVARKGGIVARGEQREQRAGRLRSVAQRIHDGGNAEAHPALAQIAEPRAQPVGVARVEPGGDDQAVERIVLGFTVEHLGNRALDRGGAGQHRVFGLTRGQCEEEIVDRGDPPAIDQRRDFLHHPEAEVLEHRNRIGQRQRALALVELEPQAGAGSGQAIEPRGAAGGGLASAQPAQHADVGSRLSGAIETAIGGRERLGKAGGERGGAGGIVVVRQLGLDRLRPAANHRLELGVERVLVRRPPGLADIDHEAQQRQAAALDLQAPVEHIGLGRAFEQRLDLEPQRGRKDIARQPDEREQVAGERCLDQRQLGPRTIDQAHHGGGDPRQVRFGEPDQQVVRQRGQRVDQAFARMAARIEPEPVHQLGKLTAHPRDPVGRGGQRGAGPHPGVDRKRGDGPVLDHRHDEQVERNPAVDVGDAVGLDDQRCQSVALAVTVEPLEGSIERGGGEQAARALAADPEQARLAAVALAQDVAELGQHPVVEPAQQRRALGIFGGLGDPLGIGEHCGLQLRPVGNCGMNIAQYRCERSSEQTALAGVAALGLEIDHRFAEYADAGRGAGVGRKLAQAALGIAPHRDHRVDQPFDRQPLFGHRRRDRIDQERHVVVDHRQPQEPLPGAAADAFERNDWLAGLTLRHRGQREDGGIAKACGVHPLGLAGKQRIGKARGERLKHRFGSARDGARSGRARAGGGKRGVGHACATLHAPGMARRGSYYFIAAA